MKTVEVGVSMTVYGTVEFSVPDEIDTPQKAAAYLKEHWDEVPRPTGTNVVPDSEEMDEESISFVG